MKHLHFRLSLFFLLISGFAQAQVIGAAFPENPKDFVEQLGQFMTASKRPDMEESFSVFKGMYKTGRFSEAEMKSIIEVSNILSSQRLSPFPYYRDYINAVSAAKADADSTLFGRWHSFAQSTIASIDKGKAKPIGSFLEFSVDFMEQRALKTGEGGSVTWKVKGRQFDFVLIENKVPVLRCRDVDLVGLRKQDSIAVLQTSGDYYPYDGVWKGRGGRVSWKDTGLDSSVYATLSGYKVESVKPLFKCDTAMLYYPLFFPGRAIAGTLEHNIVVDAKAGAEPFPRFESFEKTLQINKIGEGIEYVGGFLLRGSSLYGSGTTKEPARMTVYNKRRERIFYGTGPLFIMKKEVSVVAEGIDAKLYIEEDSLFHPAVDFRLDIPKQVISLERGTKGNERNPFFSSFYNMNLNTDRIAWHILQDSLEIGARAGIKGVEHTVNFESSKNFDENKFNRMQQAASHNPIMTLYTLWKSTSADNLGANGRTLKDNDLAFEINRINAQTGTKSNLDYSSIQPLLAQLVAEGYINYYFDRHEIEIRDKLEHYALASQGKRDYDAINIESTSSTANARLDLKTKETDIYDVKNIELSRRQRVALVPTGKEVTLLKNRDMYMTGRLFAGFALFQGKNMRFNYDKFQVEFDSVKQLDFYLPTGEVNPKTREPQATAMNSTVDMITGVLLVDAPNNKSGKEELPIFPSLQSKKNSFVFYDKPETQGRAYTRDSFYFKLDPFSFDGLDSYTKERLRFKGEMTPATIFPPFKETIVVRDHDKSFGFVHKTPPAGYSTYTKRGNYTGELDLSNKGFLGKGKLEYLTADIESEDLVFKPKQTTGTAKKFFMEEDRVSAVKVPQAKGEAVAVNWLPFKDSMYVESKAKAFELFKAPGYTHKGVLVLTPTGLKGRGEFEWTEGKLTSKQIAYGPFQAGADTANLEIKSLDGKSIALDSRNVDGELDFDAQKGDFKANSAESNTTLPLDQYTTSMNEFSWDMKAKTINFKADPTRPANFTSIDPNRNKLSFQGKTALYDMKTDLLKIGGVEVVKSADAYIYVPDTASVHILSGGKMRTIYNARILADTISKYHAISKATVEILGKKLYKAKGYYEYNIPGFNQTVFFNNITGQETGKGAEKGKNVLTTAIGDLAEKDSFRLDARTYFRGQIILEANRQDMGFDGYGRLIADKLPAIQWFTFKGVVDKNNPMVDIRNAKNDGSGIVIGKAEKKLPEEEETETEDGESADTADSETEEGEGEAKKEEAPVAKEVKPAEKKAVDKTLGDPLVTGFYFSTRANTLYPRVLLPAYNRSDRPLMNCQQFYRYDPKNDRFTFGDSLKVVQPDALKGSRMVYDNRVATIQADGPVNLCSELDHVKIKAAGRIKSDYNTYTDSTGYVVTAELMTGIEIPMPKALLDIMVNELKANTFDAGGAVYNSQAAFYQPALREFVSDSAMFGEVSTNVMSNFISLPKKDDKFTLLLGRHPLIWNNDMRSFINQEDRIPLISVAGEQISKSLNMSVAYKMQGSGEDKFAIYIKPTADMWYYIEYSKGQLILLSSSERFMAALTGLKDKEKVMKIGNGEPMEIVTDADPGRASKLAENVRLGRKQ